MPDARPIQLEGHAEAQSPEIVPDVASDDPSLGNDTGALQADRSSDRAASLPAHLPLNLDWQLFDHDSRAGRGYSVLESPDGEYYRVGSSESHFIASLLKSPSVEAAIAEQARHTNALQYSSILPLCQWLASIGAVQGVAATAKKTGADSKGNWVNKILFARLPLGSPDRILQKANALFQPAFSIPMTLAGLGLALVGLLIAVSNWSSFLGSFEGLFSPLRGIWLLFMWIALKFVHECAHAGACRRYGGSVKQAGIALFAFMPVAFVDVTSSWKFDSRWKRLHVTLAGIWIELVVAGASMLVWFYSTSPIWQSFAADLVLAASVSTIVFNLNPLMKFDGYFALADITGIDNLHQYGQHYARYFGKRFILGLSASIPELPTDRIWIRVYAVAAACWRFFALVGILIGLASLLEGAGKVLAILGALCFLLLPGLKLIQFLCKNYRGGELRPIRLVLRLSLITSLLVGCLFLIPANFRHTSPGIVEYDPPSVLRAETEGFIEQIFVSEGETVEKGQPILKLRNDELAGSLRELAARREQILQKVRASRWNNDDSQLEDKRFELEDIQNQYEHLQQQHENLTLCAPHAGRVVSRKLASKLGTFVALGADLGAIGDEGKKRLKLSLSSWEASRLSTRSQKMARIYIPGSASWKAEIFRMESRASDIPADISLTAENGGCLSVLQNAENDFRLLEPRVTAYVTLSREKALTVHCGQRCYARAGGWGRSLGDEILALILQQTPAKISWPGF
ncbi:MAG: efflux RND transporter periplasmic adaptor subunit [Planctomycetota bacterium]